MTTWNAADLANITLSNANLTATGTASTGGTRGTTAKSSGKYYCEYTITSISSNGLSTGFCQISTNLSTSSPVGAAIINRLGIIFVDNVNTTISLGTRAVADVIAVAIDITAKLIWFKVAPAGNWNNSGTANPATGVGGISISSLTTALYPVFLSGGAGDAATVNFGGATFAQAIPAGFLAWDSVVSDPYFSNVKLLLGFEGTNGSTGTPGMSDESPAAHGTATVAGSTAISTANKEFGTSSLLNAAGGRITFPNSSDWDFGAGQFTVECWVNASSFVATPYVVNHYGNSGSFGWSIYFTSSGQVGVILSTDGTNNFIFNGTTVMATGTWYHVAVDYDGIKYRSYVNGVKDGSDSTPHTIFNPGIVLSIGGNTQVGGRDFSGYIDEVRITKGVARYATDTSFTAPTAAFPRSGAASVGTATGFAAATAIAGSRVAVGTAAGLCSATAGGGVIFNPSDLLPGFPGWTTGFDLHWRQEQSTQASGRVLVKDMGAPLWTLRATTMVLSPNLLDYWRARLTWLENGLQTFKAYPMSRCYPILYPNGSWPTGPSFTGNCTLNAIASNRKAVSLSGLPAGFTLSIGDYISISGDLHQVMAQAVASGGGITPAFEVRPQIWPSQTVGATVSVKQPYCLMALVPGSLHSDAQIDGRGSVSFSAIEARL